MKMGFDDHRFLRISNQNEHLRRPGIYVLLKGRGFCLRLAPIIGSLQL